MQLVRLGVSRTDETLHLPRYHDETVNKRFFTTQDHAARFIIQVIGYDKANHGPCHWEDEMEEIAIAHAFEVLMYLEGIRMEVRCAEEAATMRQL
ncbi:hypothetical protein SLS62_008640 [Diatrype stigma]|uniref:Uncharacterized protein n=1 Tax=Diatrype stigma TaxID=117547 RepID=A0AAN9UK81_9PEZI